MPFFREYYIIVPDLVSVRVKGVSMNTAYERIKKCYEYCKKTVDFIPQAAIVLGSGLGQYAEQIEIVGKIDYKDIEGFPVSTIEGHVGQFVFGYEGHVPVVIMQGRVHIYEGYSMEDVVLPIRLMKMMGAETLYLTNAAGGVNETFEAGDFMLIKDQISSFVPSPLIGQNLNELGVRFPDMSMVYDEQLRDCVKETAKKQGIKLREGVYIQFTGPNYETPAEIRMAKLLGADAVGMSTACEAIAARHMGMQVCGISCVVNMAAGIQKTPLSHQEVQEMASRRSQEFQILLKESVQAYARI